MTETFVEAIENPALPAELAAAGQTGGDRFLIAWRALHERIERALNGTRRVVDYSVYTQDEDGFPTDNLDAVAATGRCRFEQAYDSFWGQGERYQSEEVLNPTWLQVACLANAMIVTTGDYHHSFLEAIRLVRREGEVAIYRFSMGS